MNLIYSNITKTSFFQFYFLSDKITWVKQKIHEIYGNKTNVLTCQTFSSCSKIMQKISMFMFELQLHLNYTMKEQIQAHFKLFFYSFQIQKLQFSPNFENGIYLYFLI